MFAVAANERVLWSPRPSWQVGSTLSHGARHVHTTKRICARGLPCRSVVSNRREHERKELVSVLLITPDSEDVFGSVRKCAIGSDRTQEERQGLSAPNKVCGREGPNAGKCKLVGSHSGRRPSNQVTTSCFARRLLRRVVCRPIIVIRSDVSFMGRP